MLRHGELYTCARVLDVGPWCIDDDEYIYGSSKPRAEIYMGRHCPYSVLQPSRNATVGSKEVPLSNGAGIDLFPRTARELGIAHNVNTWVEWRFIEY